MTISGICSLAAGAGRRPGIAGMPWPAPARIAASAEGRSVAATAASPEWMPADAYKMDQIKGEMKNGVLWLTMLKVKEEERKDVFQVKIE